MIPFPRPSLPFAACQKCGRVHRGTNCAASAPKPPVADDVAREREKHHGGPRVVRC
jgi:hypothetical protein